VERGLIGPRESGRLWSRHLVNCAVVAEEATDALPTGVSVADVGSGAGLPGVVWALVRPDLPVTLIEPLLRRSTFLEEVVGELGLSGRVTVLRARAEDVPQGGFDAVTARAVARLPQLLSWTLPLARPGGLVLALKGSAAASEVAEVEPQARRLGVAGLTIRTFGVGVVDPPTTVVLASRVG
jgi:16S rRNA (guanine527-N7)-methyltransferase